MSERGSGILLHITSLPSEHGIGDLGPWAYRFADFLEAAGQSFWQVLPLSPTDRARGNIPYSSFSAFAGNPLLLSPDLMVEDGFLDESDIEPAPRYPSGETDYDLVIPRKQALLDKAFERFDASTAGPEAERFRARNADWIDDYALYAAAKRRFDGSAWHGWPSELRGRQPGAIESLSSELGRDIEKEKFFQFLFNSQWQRLRSYCNGKGIRIIGDVPIYVDYDSADVWSNPGLFKLDDDGKPTCVSGVPPDYFSETGQLWGSPVYRWDAVQKTRYAWWIRRLERNFRLYDILRMDHFRGLVAYWEIPAVEKTAEHGKWVKVPSEDFFDVLTSRFESFPVVAEDLGVITPDVKETMRRYGFPGMKVLLFAFGDDLPVNPYAPHNHERNCIVYPGTHDNNTVRGWFDHEASEEEKERFFRYIGRRVSADEAHREMMRLGMMSVADTFIFSMQDLLGLGEESRMNRPATVKGNYRWRLQENALDDALAQELRTLTGTYGRLPGKTR